MFVRDFLAYRNTMIRPETSALGVEEPPAPERAPQDTTPPTLTSLTLPTTIDLTQGATTATFTAGATDVGTGVERVSFLLDRSYQTQFGLSSSITLSDSADSYADGFSSLSQFFASNTSSGVYRITNLFVYDKAGNSTIYSQSQLQALGFNTSFLVTDGSPLQSTVTVNAPVSVQEGVDSSASISLVFKNVSQLTQTVQVSYSVLSTATNGIDVNVPVGTSQFSVSQSPAGNYVFNLSPLAIIDDIDAEGSETVIVTVRAQGQIFDNGTDTTNVTIQLKDHAPTLGTTGNDVLSGGAGIDILQGLEGNDVLNGLGGIDSLNGGAGEDAINGGAGADRLTGGGGFDRFVLSAASDSSLAGFDTITDFEAGIDTLDIIALGGAARVTTAQDGATTYVYIDADGNGTRDALVLASGRAVYGSDILTTAAVGVTMLGDGGDNLLIGSARNDVLRGGDGNDVLQGGLGADTIYGGAGVDSVTFASATSGVGLNMATGVHTGEAAGDFITEVEGFVLTGFADTFNGAGGGEYVVLGAGADQAFGNAGDDYLSGGDGDDVLSGGGRIA